MRNEKAEEVVEVGPDREVCGDNFTVRISGSHRVVEDCWMPTWFEVTVDDCDGNPATTARVEVREGGPTLVDLRLTSPDVYARGIRQTDLPLLEVWGPVEKLAAALSVRIEDRWGPEIDGTPPAPGPDDDANVLGCFTQMRSRRAARGITPKLLERVAEIYRANIDSAPTGAVGSAFQVKPRTAAEYVSRARKHGLLPLTKKGQKKA